MPGQSTAHSGYFVSTKPSDRFPLWTRANVGEVFPDPVKMSTFDFAFQNDDGIRMSELAFRDAYVAIGAFTHDEFDPDECVFLGVFGGYTYLNAAVGRIFGVRAPEIDVETVDRNFFGEQPGIPPYESHPDDENSEASQRIAETFLYLFTAPALPDVFDDEQQLAQMRASRADFEQMGDHEIADWVMEHLETRIHRRHGFFASCSQPICGCLLLGGSPLGSARAGLHCSWSARRHAQAGGRLRGCRVRCAVGCDVATRPPGCGIERVDSAVQ